MDKKIVNAINKQINAEFYSGYLYLSMAAFCESKTLPGIANWFKVQSQEEMFHFSKFRVFLNDRGERVLLDAIEKPQTEFKSIKEVFEKTLEHEKIVTDKINKLYALAVGANDNATATFVQWFINEQVEEEKNVNDILGQLGFIKEDSYGILMLDKELAARVFTPPAAEAA